MAVIKADFDITFVGNFQGRIKGLDMIGKKLFHFFPRFHIKLVIGKTEMRRVVQGAACRNAKLHFLSRRVFFIKIVEIVCCHQF